MTIYLDSAPELHLNATTLTDLLEQRATQTPSQTAYIFLADGETETDRLSYQQLHQRSQSIASHLLSLGAKGACVLLLYPPGLEFIAAFFGCLYAGAIAVPAYPPRPNHSLSRLQAILSDAQATVALTTTNVFAQITQQVVEYPELQALYWLKTDQIRTDRIKPINDRSIGFEQRLSTITSDTLAFLQYTSGSTGTPKGVMITHRNLLHNQGLIQQAFQHTSRTALVGWLPLYHDMGLVGNVLQSLYLGVPCILMPPIAFLQRPVRWLQAISHYRATTSGGPNFAYDLCVRKIPPEQRSTLDLSCWDVAFNGAEPVRAETIERFTAAFAPCGFRRAAFYPCYGMAEATLIVSGGAKSAPPVFCSVDAEALANDRVVLAERETDITNSGTGVRTLVGCGHALQRVEIVDPQTQIRCQSHQVGEIWVSGTSIAQGYWRRSAETETAFRAKLMNEKPTNQELDSENQNSFLRTGDLGFLWNGELFITGRLKDLIVIRGRNYYPQDIEQTVERSYPDLRSSGGAAFSIEIAGEEKLVVAQEVERTALRRLRADGQVDQAAGAIRQAVWQEHGLQVYAVLLLKPGGIPKTSSGKIQRSTCRAKFLSESLPIVGASYLSSGNSTPENSIENSNIQSNDASTSCASELEQRLRAMIAQRLELSPAQLDLQQPLTTLGLDSVKAIEIKHHLETDFGLVLPIEAFLEDITIAELAERIAMNRSPEQPKPKLSSTPEATPSQLQVRSLPTVEPAISQERMQFSLFYFSSNAAEFASDKYQLLIEGAKFADERGFTAVWIPERHFHAFGGIYPNPSVLASALAMVTKRIRLRAGSVVLPLHHPVRVVEEWSVVDNLSQGRVDLAFARGWNPNDFVLAPDRYTDRTEILQSDINVIQKLWRGESISLTNGVGQDTAVNVYPLPCQPELPLWVTCSGGKERFIEAGAMGANVLTALLFQPIEALAEKIALYRQTREKHGHDPNTGHVTLMLHTFVGEDIATVREQVRQPFTEYLRNSIDLWRQDAKKLDELTAEEQENVLAYAFERYFQTSALFGTPDTCSKMVAHLNEIGVNEIACLIDFGVESDAVMSSLHSLKHLKDIFNKDTFNKDTFNIAAHQDENFNAIDADQAAQLLSDLDRLSDQDVEALLNHFVQSPG
jgi:natural product biosynthesis luciferase-like monooxygenase protein